MVKVPTTVEDPTLLAMDAALEKSAASTSRYSSRIGASLLGQECSRRIWYGFRWTRKETINAVSQKRFDDGHHSELVMGQRLSLVPGIELFTTDPKTNEQITFTDATGHIVCKLDGIIRGLIQSPSKWHIWEHKCTNDSKFRELERDKVKEGEKGALAKWDAVYHAQAQISMYFAKFDRHYLTCASAGSRVETSVRTDANHQFADALIAKGHRIIEAREPLTRISDDPTNFKCKFCPFQAICHAGATPDRNCRTCAHSRPVENGQWLCGKHGNILTLEEQLKGCDDYERLETI